MRFFKYLAVVALALSPGALAANVIKRINKENAILLIVDHQIGLFHLVQDMNNIAFANNIVAHAALGPIFNLPTILTTSAETGKSRHQKDHARDMS